MLVLRIQTLGPRKQKVDSIVSALIARPVQRRLLIVIECVHKGAVVDEERQGECFITLRCNV